MKIALIVLTLLFASPALAEEWVVTRVRGEVTQEVGAAWQAVQRGDVITNERHIKTGANGRVGLARGAETIELQGNTQIRIQDAGPERMTSVLQDFGTVSIEAERRNVQHFSVQTPFLAAVVKGTRFTVTTDQTGASVEVDRGVVQVQDTLNDLVVDVQPGQEAKVSPEAPLLVEGAGDIAVYNFKGAQVVNGTADEIGASPGNSSSSNAGGNGKGNAFGLYRDAGESMRGKSGSSNAGGNSGKSNADGTGNGGSSNGSGNGNSGSSNAGGNGNGNANGVSKDSSAAATGLSSDTGSAPGNSGNSSAGGNGKGNANGLDK